VGSSPAMAGYFGPTDAGEREPLEPEPLLATFAPTFGL